MRVEHVGAQSLSKRYSWTKRRGCEARASDLLGYMITGRCPLPLTLQTTISTNEQALLEKMIGYK